MNEDCVNQITFSDYIIAMLLSSRSTKVFWKVLHDRVKKRSRFKNSNFSQELRRLEGRGLLSITNNEITFNPDRLKIHQKISYIRVEPKKERKIIMIFDIPETNRKTRDWLRNQIKLWGFKMIQKSVWLGSGPLPKEFNERIKYLNIDKHIKVFNVEKVEKTKK